VQAATWIAFNPHLEETPMRRITLIALLLASPLVIADSDIIKVNGSVRAEAGAKYDELSTVNGSITVGRGAHARTVETVNGGINVDDQAEIGSLETVNGGIDIGEAVVVSQGVSTVNGAIDIERGSRVEGKVETVNGRIQLMASEIGRGIETVNGDITVGADSIVRGGILVEEPSGSGWFNWGNKPKRTPKIVIGRNALVEGTLEFKREVELYVHDSASVGKVIGATAKRFSGEYPQ
jgi:hypothetical protein